MFGAPIAASLLALDGLCGLAGWQWLFVVEGLPTIALGAYIARTLAPSPAQAAFLTPEEREWLCARNARVKARSFLLSACTGSCWQAQHSCRRALSMGYAC